MKRAVSRKPARPRRLGFFLPGGIRHFRRVSPHLAFEREDGVVRRVWLRGEPWLDLASLDTWQAPHTLAIVGSGPSIRDMDLARLPEDSTMLLNGTISLMPKVRPFCIVIEDRRFVDRHWQMLRPALASGARLIASAEVLSAIAERDTAAVEGDVILNDSLTKPVDGPRRDRGANRVAPPDFTDRPERGTIRGGSVAVTAFQWAAALGPARIAFAGVELWNADAPRFYERQDMAKSGIVRAQDRILRHIEAGVRLAHSRGIKIVNLSPGSALETIGIETVPLDQL